MNWLSILALGFVNQAVPSPSLLLSQALMNVNSRLRELYPDSEELFDIVLMTNNHAQVGVRLINSINHYGTLHLKSNTWCKRMNGKKGVVYFFKHLQRAFRLSDLTIERFCMTGGQSPIGYLKAYMTNLYLSKDSEKVTEAIEEGKWKPFSVPVNSRGCRLCSLALGCLCSSDIYTLTHSHFWGKSRPHAELREGAGWGRRGIYGSEWTHKQTYIYEAERL